MARLNNARSRVSSLERSRPPQLAASFECRLLAVATKPQYLSLWRDLLIDELSESGSFAQTHIVIAKLLKHTEFSATQIEQLVQIARSNRQVAWIIGDSDVHAFESLLKHKHKLSGEAES
jgi:hypothetical protein